MFHGGGGTVSPLYLVDILFPKGAMGVPALEVTEFETHPQFDLLIGMDIINIGDFAITNADGQTMMSFCYPPRRHINFETESA